MSLNLNESFYWKKAQHPVTLVKLNLYITLYGVSHFISIGANFQGPITKDWLPGSLSDIRSLAFLCLEVKSEAHQSEPPPNSGFWISALKNTSGHLTGLISALICSCLFRQLLNIRRIYSGRGYLKWRALATWQQPLANINDGLFTQTNHTLD